jgi:hypothetical protein
MCVSDAAATGWSARIGSLAGGELLMPTPAPRHDNIVSFPLNSPAERGAKRGELS